MYEYICLILLFLLAILFFISNIGAKKKPRGKKKRLTEIEKDGVCGENRATKIINGILKPDDIMLRNVELKVDGRRTELDIVVVNRNGVFIFEVKNYKGYIEGDEEAYEWKKYNTTEAGNTYMKIVKNPIKQVKREIFLLSEYLKRHGIKVWVYGYAMLLHNNSPVHSEQLVYSKKNIDKVIHTSKQNRLTRQDISKIEKLLINL